VRLFSLAIEIAATKAKSADADWGIVGLIEPAQAGFVLLAVISIAGAN
jgi:hypothetical protein